MSYMLDTYLEKKNQTLISYYKIAATPGKLIALLPPEQTSDHCPYCSTRMLRRRKSKSASITPPAECPNCQHKIFLSSRMACMCGHCIAAQQQAEFELALKKRKAVQATHRIDLIPTIDYYTLSFTHKIALLTLFRAQTNEAFEKIQSLTDLIRRTPLTPTNHMNCELISELFRHGAIAVDPESPLEAFSDEDPEIFDISTACWISNIAIDGSKQRATLRDVHARICCELHNGIQSEWGTEIKNLLFKITTEEILQYVNIKSSELYMPCVAEKKTRETVTELLKTFSVSELYYLVDLSVKNANTFYSKRLAVSKRHAANTIQNKLFDLGTRAARENWNRRYNRDSRAPRSEISRIFFDQILCDEDAGFNNSPEAYWSQHLQPKYFHDDTEGSNELPCINCSSKNLNIHRKSNILDVYCQNCGMMEQFELIS